MKTMILSLTVLQALGWSAQAFANTVSCSETQYEVSEVPATLEITAVPGGVTIAYEKAGVTSQFHALTKFDVGLGANESVQILDANEQPTGQLSMKTLTTFPEYCGRAACVAHSSLHALLALNGKSIKFLCFETL